MRRHSQEKLWSPHWSPEMWNIVVNVRGDDRTSQRTERWFAVYGPLLMGLLLHSPDTDWSNHEKTTDRSSHLQEFTSTQRRHNP